MADIYEPVEMWSAQTGTITTTDGRMKKVSINRAFTVVSLPDDTWKDLVVKATELPQTSEPHPELNRLICTKKTPKRLSPVFWQVDVTYEGEIGPDGVESTPLDDPAEYAWSKNDREEEIDEDINNEAVQTEAGEKYDNLSMTICDLVLNVKKNYLTINLPGTYQYLHSVNSDTFVGFQPGIAKLTGFSAKHVIAPELEQGYWEVNATITFRYPWRTEPRKAWWKRIKHEGYYEKDDDGKRVRACDGHKEPVVRPIPLDENGKKLEDPTDKSAIVYKDYQIYQELPYNALGLIDN
jgi:hypothetical protein